MSLRDFLKLYNFKQIYSQKENTQIVRIYTEFPANWFEFGINDWSWDKNRDELVESYLNKKLLDREVVSINYDEDNDVFCIHTEALEVQKNT